MSSRYTYFYFMRSDVDQIRATAPQHAAHWRDRVWTTTWEAGSRTEAVG
jgi:hypothetical protein